MTQETARNGYAHPETLVETEWVAQHLNDSQTRLIEVDVDASAYDTGHIAGAVGWRWQADLQRRPVRDILTQQEWEALLARSGVTNETEVILYGDNNNWFAAFAYWLFKLYGHGPVRLMNGGRKKWMDEGRALTTQVPAYPMTTYHAKAPDMKLRALREEVRAAQAAQSVTLVDVRSPGEFSGELLAPEHLPQEGAQRGGHMPGAKNIPWGHGGRGGRHIQAGGGIARDLWRQGGDARSASHRLLPHRRTISAHMGCAHELLGYDDVRNYDGSWTEWGSLVNAPVEVGA